MLAMDSHMGHRNCCLAWPHMVLLQSAAHQGARGGLLCIAALEGVLGGIPLLSIAHRCVVGGIGQWNSYCALPHGKG